MVVRRVVRHEIQNEPDACLMQFGNQAVQIIETAEDWIDRTIVGEVVAEVTERALVYWRQPDGVDAKPFQIVQTRQQADQVAFAVSIGVLK
jgi:hypothetical protein